MMDMDDDPTDKQTPTCVVKETGCDDNDRLVICSLLYQRNKHLGEQEQQRLQLLQTTGYRLLTRDLIQNLQFGVQNLEAARHGVQSLDIKVYILKLV